MHSFARIPIREDPMTTLPPTPSGVIRIQHLIEVFVSEPVTSRMFFNYTGAAPTVGNLNTLAGDCLTAWNTNMQPLLSNNSALYEIDLQDLASLSGASTKSAQASTGSRAGNPPTVGAAALVKYGIARRYRGGKPKGFWPFGIISDEVEGNQWSPAFVTAVSSGVAAYAAAIAALTIGSTNMGNQCNVSYYHGYLPPTVLPNNRAKNHLAPRGTPVLDTIVNWTCDARLGSQRRRIFE